MNSPKKWRTKISWVLDEAKYLNFEEVQKLRESCKKMRDLVSYSDGVVTVRDWFMIELSLFTGLRVEEMRNLKCGDLLLEEDRSSIIVRKGKGNKKRVVQIGEEFKNTCFTFLRWKRKVGQDTDKDSFLLVSKKGKLTKRALQKAFKRCTKRAGLATYYSIHCLRHTYACFLYKASKHNLKLVQRQLGHSSIKTTEVYANLLDSDVKEAVENLYKR